ncbi:MAG TPA: helix-turn-helix domain-containing protein, partial [Candidatus Coprenecus pullistercoris]|nr:helix-turn-helix domain-containing protein [Candidatus Coprenecus pullistercoris]
MTILTVFTALCLYCCRGQEETVPDRCAEVDSLEAAGDLHKAVTVATGIYDSAMLAGDARTAASAGTRLVRLFYLTDSPDSMFHYFDAALQDAERLGMYRECMAMHNIIGVFDLINALEYESALYHFYESMAYAQKCADLRSYYMKLVNVSIIHYIRKDSTGLATAVEILDYGRETSDTYFLYTGTLMLAYMHHCLGDDRTALECIQKLEQWPEHSTGANSYEPLYASVLANLDQDTEAERIFLHCLGQHGNDDRSLQIETLAGYGNFLSDNGRLHEAVKYYLEGLELTERYGLYFYGYNIYKELADTYSAMGQYSLAMEYLGKYYGLNERVFNVERERSFNSLLRKYERQKSDNELQEKDMRLLRMSRQMDIAVAALILAAVIVPAIVVRNRARNRMYRQLAEKYNTYLKRESELMERLENAGKQEITDNGRLKELFDRLTGLMTDDGLYAVKNLTVEDAAGRLGTNRSYLSKAVNTYAGTSFNTWLNSIRIKESIRLLLSSETPIKTIADQVGYSNLTS